MIGRSRRGRDQWAASQGKGWSQPLALTSFFYTVYGTISWCCLFACTLLLLFWGWYVGWGWLPLATWGNGASGAAGQVHPSCPAPACLPKMANNGGRGTLAEVRVRVAGPGAGPLRRVSARNKAGSLAHLSHSGPGPPPPRLISAHHRAPPPPVTRRRPR